MGQDEEVRHCGMCCIGHMCGGGYPVEVGGGGGDGHLGVVEGQSGRL
jgi:hypothetical protein